MCVIGEGSDILHVMVLEGFIEDYYIYNETFTGVEHFFNPENEDFRFFVNYNITDPESNIIIESNNTPELNNNSEIYDMPQDSNHTVNALYHLSDVMDIIASFENDEIETVVLDQGVTLVIDSWLEFNFSNELYISLYPGASILIGSLGAFSEATRYIEISSNRELLEFVLGYG